MPQEMKEQRKAIFFSFLRLRNQIFALCFNTWGSIVLFQKATSIVREESPYRQKKKTEENILLLRGQSNSWKPGDNNKGCLEHSP